MSIGGIIRGVLVLGIVAGLSGAAAAMQDPGGGRPAGQRGRGGQRPGGDGERRGPGGEGQRVSVEGAMKSIKRAMKQLRKQVTDSGKKDDNLKLINEMQRGCVACKGQPLPNKVLRKAKDDAEKAKFTQDYRKQLMTSLRMMLDIEQDIVDGKGDDAATKLEQLDKLHDDAHHEMGIKED